MPWRAKSVMDQRIDFVLQACKPGACLARLCREYGISRQCGYTWLQRYREVGSVTGLAERSRRPHHCPRQTAPATEAVVMALWQEYGWGARKLEVVLAGRGMRVPEWTINRILKRHGAVRVREVQGQARQRFARAEPNQLLQMDFKGEYPVAEGRCHPLSLLDDHSRYLVGLWPLPRVEAQGVKEALEGLFREQGVPQALLLDRGVPWWSTTNGHGLTWLSVWLLDQALELIYGRPYHPQTRGKVERFHRTLKERTKHEGLLPDLAAWQEWAPRFRHEYNALRPHEALGMKVPAQVYDGRNLRPYQEQPRAYDYGEAGTRQLNSQGCLPYGRGRYFVCEALAGRRVRVDELDGLLIVTYRTVTVREINLRTGRSRAVVLPARSGNVSRMSC